MSLPKLYLSPFGAVNSFFKCQPRPKPVVGFTVLGALGDFVTISDMSTSLLGILLICCGVPASRAVHREQRIARVSESADTGEPQKKQSMLTFVPALRLDINSLRKSYTEVYTHGGNMSIPILMKLFNIKYF